MVKWEDYKNYPIKECPECGCTTFYIRVYIHGEAYNYFNTDGSKIDRKVLLLCKLL